MNAHFNDNINMYNMGFFCTLYLKGDEAPINLRREAAFL